MNANMKPLAEWTPDEVWAWSVLAASLPFEAAAILHTNGVAGQALGEMTESESAALGFAKFGWRRQLSIGVQAIIHSQQQCLAHEKVFGEHDGLGISLPATPALPSRGEPLVVHSDAVGQVPPVPFTPALEQVPPLASTPSVGEAPSLASTPSLPGNSAQISFAAHGPQSSNTSHRV